MATRIIGPQFSRRITATSTTMRTRYVHYLTLSCGHTERVTGRTHPKNNHVCVQCWADAGHPSPQAQGPG